MLKVLDKITNLVMAIAVIRSREVFPENLLHHSIFLMTRVVQEGNPSSLPIQQHLCLCRVVRVLRNRYDPLLPLGSRLRLSTYVKKTFARGKARRRRDKRNAKGL